MNYHLFQKGSQSVFSKKKKKKSNQNKNHNVGFIVILLGGSAASEKLNPTKILVPPSPYTAEPLQQEAEFAATPRPYPINFRTSFRNCSEEWRRGRSGFRTRSHSIRTAPTPRRRRSVRRRRSGTSRKSSSLPPNSAPRS